MGEMYVSNRSSQNTFNCLTMFSTCDIDKDAFDLSDISVHNEIEHVASFARA